MSEDFADQDPHWQFLYICEVLQAPSWEVPITSFIDENCIVFDNEEENKFAYSDLHNEFKDLVERLLTQHLTEIGVSADDFYQTCEAAYNSGTSDIGTKIIEQILACDDFLTFKSIMFERNKELEYEALSTLNFNEDGELDNALEQSSVEAKEQEQAAMEEKNDIELALRLSMEGDQSQIAALDKEEAELQKAIAMSLVLEEEKVRMMAEKEQYEESKLPDESKTSCEESKMSGESKFGTAIKPNTHALFGSPLPPIQASAINEKRNDIERFLEEDLTKNGKAMHGEVDRNDIDQYELIRRSKHLKAQREKLMRKKKKEREARLKEYEEQKRDGPSNKSKSKDTSYQKGQKHHEQGGLTYALARRMKYELINETSDRQGYIDESENGTFMSLDDKLRAVEELRQKRVDLLQGN